MSTENSKPLVSVCITTYNMQDYIGRALDSVLTQQTDFDFEIIVSDDSSTDSTLDILEFYKQKAGSSLTVLEAEENKGLIENFVKALRESRGKYIATLDADDYWIDPLKLQKQVDILNRQAEIGFVYTNYYNETASNGTRRAGYSKGHRYPGNNAYFSMIASLFVQISTPCFRRSLLDLVPMDEFVKRKFVAQDLSFFLGFSLVTIGYYIPDFTTVYTIREGSMSHEKDFEKRILNYEKCFEIGNYYIEKHPAPANIIDKRQFQHSFNLLLASWQTRDFEKVQKFIKPLLAKDFFKYNKKAWYIYHASKHKFLFRLFAPWVLRKRG